MIAGCPQCTLSRRAMMQRIGGAVLAGTVACTTPSARGHRPEKASGLRAVDFHAHMIEPTLAAGATGSLAAIYSEVRKRPGWLGKLTNPGEQIADMDLYGIDCHVIGQSNAIQGITWGDALHDLKIHQRVNDVIAEQWVATHPDRFIGAFGLPTQDVALAVKELERAVTVLGHKVLQISSHTPDGVYYGDPRLLPLWEAIAHYQITVFIHPHGQMNSPPLDQFGLNNSVGQPIEEAKVMSSIIYQGIFDRFPEVKIVVAHGGGFLPHYYGRMDRNVKNVPGSADNISLLPSKYLKHFYYDTCVYSPDILKALINVVGVDRLVLGGDYPVGGYDPVAALREVPDLSEEARDLIMHHTPARLLQSN